MDNKPTVESVQALITRGPFHQWLGLQVQRVADGEIDIKATWRPEWVVNPDGGYTHGGILATLIDLTADWALVSTTGRGVPTIDMRVDYHRPAMKGDLVCKGKVVKGGKLFSSCEAQIYNAEGQLLASGRGVYAMPAPKTA
ncbi:PaaI family thioesterase [Pseudorhodoferax sp.]|uniref:PaaI family thioesterase n=1 Tax=Pseudorhodoferax sp. TaxID=1993553 RepID=UPI002DD68FBC|nr:PaaI family thioesterase [Pseudorhodoferax sp.]